MTYLFLVTLSNTQWHSNTPQKRREETSRRFYMLQAPVRCARVRMAWAAHGVRALHLHIQHAAPWCERVLERRPVVVAPLVLELRPQLLLPLGLAQHNHNLLPVLHRRLERTW